MKSVSFVVPGKLTTRTGGSIYDRRIVEGLRARGWIVSVVELDSVSHPLAPPLHSAAAQFGRIPDGEVVLVDGLAFGTMPEVIENESWRLKFVPIIHMALSTTPGLTRGEAAWLSNLERRALARAQHIIITGARTRSYVTAMIGGQGDDHVTRIPPGIDRSTVGDRLSANVSPRLLCVANLTWGKGHDILLRALEQVVDRDWTLTCVGSADREPRYADWLRTTARDRGLESRIEWVGELDGDLGHRFMSADLFVLPTRSETYGMAVAEAIAHGVPVVSTRTGEIPSIVGDGGLLADPGDVDGLATLLRQVISDATVRRQLAEHARAAADRLPTWNDAADAVVTVLERVRA